MRWIFPFGCCAALTRSEPRLQFWTFPHSVSTLFALHAYQRWRGQILGFDSAHPIHHPMKRDARCAAYRSLVCWSTGGQHFVFLSLLCNTQFWEDQWLLIAALCPCYCPTLLPLTSGELPSRSRSAAMSLEDCEADSMLEQQ